MQKRYKKEGFEIIAINVDKDRSLATEFLNQSAPGFTIAYDPEGKVRRKLRPLGNAKFISD